MSKKILLLLIILSCFLFPTETAPEVPSLLYFLSRILGTFFTLLLAAAILWRKKTLSLKLFSSLGGGGNQTNVITLNQTVWIRVILCADLLLVYLLENIIETNNIFLFEILKLILVDNICYRFFFPVYLIINAKYCLPELFSKKSIRKLDFFKSRQNLIPRRNDLNINLSGKTTPIPEIDCFKAKTSSKVIHVKEFGQRSFKYLGK